MRHCILVGRIIVANGAATATLIESAFDIAFSPSSLAYHNDLSGIQDAPNAVSNEHYHLSSIQASSVASLAGLSYTVPSLVTMISPNTFGLTPQPQVNTYVATYASVTTYSDAAFLALIGTAYSPDGTPVVNGDTILFTGNTTTANRGVYQAVVVGGVVTSLTRIQSGQSVTGVGTIGDSVYIALGSSYGGRTFRCTVTATNTWVSFLYVNALGVSGGQTIDGGTGNGELLILSSTNSSIKGKIYLGAFSVYDEVNNRLGLNTASPTNDLSFGNTSARKMWIENSAADVVGRNLTISAGSTIAGISVNDVVGGTLVLQAGLGTGVGGSSIVFQTGRTLTTGKILQTPTTAMTILGTGSVGIGTSVDGMTPGGSLAVAQDFAHRGTKAGFFNTTPIVKPSGDILAALSNLGLVDSPSLIQFTPVNLTSFTVPTGYQYIVYGVLEVTSGVLDGALVII